jgi:hypothetical protein
MARMSERASERAVLGLFDARSGASFRALGDDAARMLRIAQRSLPTLAALLVLAAPASAAEVARIDGASLDARDSPREGGFCLRVSESRDGLGGGSGTCGRAPWRSRRSALVTWIHDERLIVGGAVPAAVARAEAELADGRRMAFDTVAGAGYRGRHAGRLRFFLASLPLADPADDEAGGLLLVRFLGADGALVAVAAADRRGALAGRRTRLLRERARGRSITVTVETRRRHAPTPLALDRTEEQTCMEVRERARFGSLASSTFCHEQGPARPDLLVVPRAGCDGLRTVLAGFVGTTVTAVRIQLGSGRVREVAVRTLRDPSGGEHRYVALRVPRGEAVRSVRAVGADAGYELAVPPSGLACNDAAESWTDYAPLAGDPGAARAPAGDEQVVAEAAGHRLLARDAEADRLCVGLDLLYADGSDCALPAVNGEEAFAFARDGAVWAVLPSEVARVRLPDGREVSPAEGGYRGRYAGAVRFLLVERGAVGLDRLRLLDAGGGTIGTVPVFDPAAAGLEPVARPVRLAAGRGWRLTAARHRYGTCLYLILRGQEPLCGAGYLRGDDGAFAAVGCSPRVAVLMGTLDRRTRAVRAVLRGGRTLRARVVRVPRRAGGGRAWVLDLPRRARVTDLRFDGRRTAFPLLPAADQCGYRVFAPGLAEAVTEFVPR